MSYKMESLVNRWEKEIKKKEEKEREEFYNEFFTNTEVGKRLMEISKKNKAEKEIMKELYKKVKNRKA